MTPKFIERQYVEVSGTATGYGDMIGWIQSIELSNILKEPYYHIRVYSEHVATVYVAERFVSETQKNNWHLEIQNQYAPYFKKALIKNGLSYTENLLPENTAFDILISGPMDAYKVGMEMCFVLIDKVNDKQYSN